MSGALQLIGLLTVVAPRPMVADIEYARIGPYAVGKGSWTAHVMRRDKSMTCPIGAAKDCYFTWVDVRNASDHILSCDATVSYDNGGIARQTGTGRGQVAPRKAYSIITLNAGARFATAFSWSVRCTSSSPTPSPQGQGSERSRPSTQMFIESEVDDPVVPISIPSPRFPPVLQQAGVSGFVEATYVVSTTGRPEPSSWRVQRSSNQQFEGPAREAVMKGIFKPARIKGVAVRQLVQQRISFTIGQ
jgi:TonB family protein